ncbi:hypothetical protein BQ8794_290062 [Mesorhizobium prunaredense]|uniref:Uncharacterized protein n=1 Tax=Mesorhizobium prunaredense TaxID=1631249 RepID=A0A1R3V955_9HYPH|nr:hypothetical protein BQ8794_290062 [Mesorhizobium prunaredense]
MCRQSVGAIVCMRGSAEEADGVRFESVSIPEIRGCNFFQQSVTTLRLGQACAERRCSCTLRRLVTGLRIWLVGFDGRSNDLGALGRRLPITASRRNPLLAASTSLTGTTRNGKICQH